MRVALVTETFPPEVNGVAMTLNRLCRGLLAIGHEVKVVRPLQQDESFDALYPFEGGEQFVVPGIPLPGYDGLRMGRPALLGLYRDWKEWEPDIVHIATEGPLGIACLAAAGVLSIPTSSTFHTNFHQYSQHYKIGFFKDLFWVYLRQFHNRIGCTLPPTREMADELIHEGFERVNVLSRGVDTDLFSPERRDPELRKLWGVSDADRVYLYVGRVAAEKNIQLAIDAFEAVRLTDESAKMVVVGDGPELTRLKKRYSHIHYAGMQKGEDLARHYASGDCFLFPSITETFGNVVTEAMSSGLAVLTYDYAAGRQCIVSGKNGVLAAFDERNVFLKQARALAACDGNVLLAMGAEARKTACSISWDRVVEILLESWQRVIVENRVSIC